MPLMSMLVPGRPRVKASSARKRVAGKRIAQANPDVEVLTLTVHGREEFLFQAPLACAQGHILDG